MVELLAKNACEPNLKARFRSSLATRPKNRIPKPARPAKPAIQLGSSKAWAIAQSHLTEERLGHGEHSRCGLGDRCMHCPRARRCGVGRWCLVCDRGRPAGDEEETVIRRSCRQRGYTLYRPDEEDLMLR